MQAQVPRDPYVGLWARLEGFRPEELSQLIVERRAIRAQLMRSTIHLATARDALTLRPSVQPALERTFSSTQWRKNVDGVNLFTKRETSSVTAEGLRLLRS